MAMPRYKCHKCHRPHNDYWKWMACCPDKTEERPVTKTGDVDLVRELAIKRKIKEIAREEKRR